MVNKAGNQHIQTTLAGTRKAEARRAEVEDRLAFKGGINTGGDKRSTQNGSAALAGTVNQGTGNQPLSSGTRGTIVNISA